MCSDPGYLIPSPPHWVSEVKGRWAGLCTVVTHSLPNSISGPYCPTQRVQMYSNDSSFKVSLNTIPVSPASRVHEHYRTSNSVDNRFCKVHVLCCSTCLLSFLFPFQCRRSPSNDAFTCFSTAHALACQGPIAAEALEVNAVTMILHLPAWCF